MKKVKILQLLVVSVSVAFALLFAGCSDAKLIQYHLKKAEKHGGKIVCVSDTVTITDTIMGPDGIPQIIEKQIPCECDPCNPKTETRFEIKWKYKYDLKRQKMRDAFVSDSTRKAIEKEIKLARIEKNKQKNDSMERIKEKKEETQQENANNVSWNITLICIAVVSSLLLLLLLYAKFKQR